MRSGVGARRPVPRLSSRGSTCALRMSAERSRRESRASPCGRDAGVSAVAIGAAEDDRGILVHACAGRSRCGRPGSRRLRVGLAPRLRRRRRRGCQAGTTENTRQHEERRTPQDDASKIFARSYLACPFVVQCLEHFRTASRRLANTEYCGPRCPRRRAASGPPRAGAPRPRQLRPTMSAREERPPLSRRGDVPCRCPARAAPGCAARRAPSCRRSAGTRRSSMERTFGVRSSVGAETEQRCSAGIHEVRLALVLRRAQAREEAVALRERDAAAAHERNRLADPEARVRARELRILEDRVEARAPCRRTGSLSPDWIERIEPQAHPVEVARELGARRSPRGLSLARSPGQRIALVAHPPRRTRGPVEIPAPRSARRRCSRDTRRGSRGGRESPRDRRPHEEAVRVVEWPAALAVARSAPPSPAR